MIKAIIFDWFGVLYHSDEGCNQELFNVIQTLRPGYKIGLLSNVNLQAINMCVSVQNRDRLFDDIVLSGEVGLAKSHPRIFQLAAQRLGVEPEECVFIDDMAQNCAAAAKVGMHTIVFTNTEQTIVAIKRLISKGSIGF